jgi:GDP-4-dehydro-6-deoxy-D-mannose reductase
MRVLITGITGFVGSHMAEFALAQGVTVCGACRWRSNPENLIGIRSRVQLVESDLRDQSSTTEMLATAQPDVIFHLAGQSQVMTSWHAPAETLHTNIIGQAHLLEAIRHRGAPFPTVLVVGSSEEYGLVKESDLPVTERHELSPLSPYAVSKVAQDMLAYQYFRSYGIPCLRVRAFNHDGPRRGEVFVTSAFARQIAEIELGRRAPVIRVGNLKARRDYTDVRDMVRGYWLLAQKGRPGEVYNLCSGESHAIQEILDFFLAQATVKNIRVEEDPVRLRPSDLPNLFGSAGKAYAETGWQPQISFEQMLLDVLNYWRERVRQTPASPA